MGLDSYSSLETGEQNEAPEIGVESTPLSETEVLKQALQFYANKENYVPTEKKNSTEDRYLSRVELDNGAEAQIALEKVKQLNEPEAKTDEVSADNTPETPKAE